MRQESGRSMIEMLGVLAIMGVITVAAVTMISTAMQTQKRTAVNDEVAVIVSGVRQLFGEYDDFSLINSDTIFDAIGVSSKNTYGGTYQISPDAANSRNFVVSINGLTKKDCVFFSTKAWRDSTGFQSSDGKSGGATGSCNSSDSDNSVQITYGD